MPRVGGDESLPGGEGRDCEGRGGTEGSGSAGVASPWEGLSNGGGLAGDDMGQGDTGGDLSEEGVLWGCVRSGAVGPEWAGVVTIGVLRGVQGVLG